MGFKGNYLWKDRKRWLGMPLSFTRYALSGPSVPQRGFSEHQG